MTTQASGTVNTPATRPLAIAWLVATAPVAAAAFMMSLVSDRPGDAAPGLALSLLAVSGIAMSTWMFVSPNSKALILSLATSVVWMGVAVAVYPTQDFVADAVWSTGLTAVGALVTGALAVRAGRAGL